MCIFVDKTRKIVRIEEEEEEEEEEEMNCEKIMCLFFGPNWVYIRDKCPWAMAHGFSHDFFIQKAGYHEVL